jgi:hypothetical protein
LRGAAKEDHSAIDSAVEQENRDAQGDERQRGQKTQEKRDQSGHIGLSPQLSILDWKLPEGMQQSYSEID